MKHILIIDDDKLNIMVCGEILSKQYKISVARSGLEAIRYFENKTCDLILLDINMPNMDGFEVMARLQSMENAKKVPVIFLTANNDAKIEIKCLENGAQDFITKPFVDEVLCSRIDRILELAELRSVLENQLDAKTKEVEEIATNSQRDVLTGLWNRAYMEKKVNEIIKDGGSGVLFMMDIDRFKAINDNYGHLAGDHVLKVFAEILKQYVDENDIVSRIGGDEFVIFFEGERANDILIKKAECIIADMLSKLDECKYETNSSVSIGIAKCPENGENFADLYSASDKALYHVKLNGKNTYHFYGASSRESDGRSANMVDINYLKDLMLRSEVGNGTYRIDFENFHHLYNFVQRFTKRNKREVFTLLFTLKYRNDKRIEANEIEEAISRLEDAIFTSLRKVDISTRYSNHQMIVILMDSNYENTQAIAKRIIDNYEKDYNNKDLFFSCDIAQMEN